VDFEVEEGVLREVWVCIRGLFYIAHASGLTAAGSYWSNSLSAFGGPFSDPEQP
jgi:hypothetical protein